MARTVGIIGGGIAGLTAAYLLRDTHEVTLFEREDRLGGNAYTYRSPDGDDIDISVFAFSHKSYPNFFRLLAELGVETGRFALSGVGSTAYNLDTHEAHYFAPMTLRGWREGNFRTAREMRAATQQGVKMLDAGLLAGLSMQEALRLIPELRAQAYFHLIFALCLTSSMSYEEVMRAPATFFFGKMKTHFMYGPTVWRLVKRRTQGYMRALATPLGERIMLNAGVRRVVRGEDDVTLHMETGDARHFDAVVFACPADTALRMLEDPTADERRLLGAWRYKEGLVVVHRDERHFPPEPLRNMYAYMYTNRDGRIETSINACYKRQKGVSKTSPYLGTQHPNFPIREDLVAFQKVFRTPIFEPASVATAKALPTLNGHRHSYFCGSHFGFGLHEDAVTSAMAVSKALGGRLLSAA